MSGWETCIEGYIYSISQMLDYFMLKAYLTTNYFIWLLCVAQSSPFHDNNSIDFELKTISLIQHCIGDVYSSNVRNTFVTLVMYFDTNTVHNNFFIQKLSSVRTIYNFIQHPTLQPDNKIYAHTSIT